MIVRDSWRDWIDNLLQSLLSQSSIINNQQRDFMKISKKTEIEAEITKKSIIIAFENMFISINILSLFFRELSVILTMLLIAKIEKEWLIRMNERTRVCRVCKDERRTSWIKYWEYWEKEISNDLIVSSFCLFVSRIRTSVFDKNVTRKRSDNDRYHEKLWFTKTKISQMLTNTNQYLTLWMLKLEKLAISLENWIFE